MSDVLGVCGNPAHQVGAVGEALCRFPPGSRIGVAWVGGVGAFSQAEALDMWLAAAAAWSPLSGIAFRPASSSASADIVCSAAPLGGNILAQATLPCGRFGQLTQEFNSSFTWDRDRFMGVALHETGHSLGIGHASSRGCVMSPVFEGLVDFCSFDRAEVERRYGSGGGGGGGGALCDLGRAIKRLRRLRAISRSDFDAIVAVIAEILKFLGLLTDE